MFPFHRVRRAFTSRSSVRPTNRARLQVESLPERIMPRAGDLDLAFANQGKATLSFTANDDTSNAVALQSDGQVVVAGQAFVGTPFGGGNNDFALARFSANGTPDTSFGSGGKVTLDFGSSDVANAVLVQPDGKILAIGTSNFFGSTFALSRFDPSGSLDTTFGNGGKVITQFPGFAGKSAYAAALQTDGKIVVSGSDGEFTLARYNANGSLDSSFGTGGLVNTSGVSRPRGVAVQADGKIVVAGAGPDANNVFNKSDFAVVRYNANGTLDTSFGSGGKVLTPFSPSGSDDDATSVLLMNDGRIVVAGEAVASVTSSVRVGLARYNPNGSLDATFGVGGLTTFDASTVQMLTPIVSAALQPDGMIVVGYGHFTGGFGGFQGDFGILRVTSSGALDTTFGNGGRVTTSFGNSSSETSYDVLVQPDGKIVATGASSGDFAVARYLGDVPDVPDGPPAANLAAAADIFAHSREHYQDFVIKAYRHYLQREPDPAGLDGWTNLMLARQVSDEQLEAHFLSSPEYINRKGGIGAPWVTGMYQDLLGRTPTQAEVDSWVQRLQTDLSPFQVAFGFAASVERASQRIRANYGTYLERVPSQAEVDAWVALFVGGRSNEDMIGGFVGSPEYYQHPNKGRGNELYWILAAYRDVLFRTPGTREINDWLNFLR